jgi:hypothetical protein
MVARQTEIGWVVVEEDAEEADTCVVAWAAAADDTV